jgi:hypothetical protein
MTISRRDALTGAAALAAIAALQNAPSADAAPLADDPLDGLTADAGDIYDLCVWLHVAFDRYPGGVFDGRDAVLGAYCIEAGRGPDEAHLTVSPWNGDLEAVHVTGDPLIDLRDPTGSLDPLALLRALLTGQTI